MKSFINYLLIFSLLVAEFGGMRPVTAQTRADVYQLMIISTPGNAEVYIDNRYVGTTPYAEWLPPGDYQVRVSKERHTVWESRIRLQDDVRLTMTLAPAARLSAGSKTWILSLVGALVAIGGIAAAAVIIRNRTAASSEHDHLAGSP